MTPPDYVCEFTSSLRRVPLEGGGVFAAGPEGHAAAVTEGWGRVPVRAVVDGQEWETSLWRSRAGVTELAVPERIRGGKDDGDTVRVRLEYSVAYRT